MFLVIISALAQFLSSSLFAQGMHFLLTSFGANGKSESDADLFTSNVVDMLKTGQSVYQAIDSLIKDFGASHRQALSSAAAATAVLARDGIHLDNTTHTVIPPAQTPSDASAKAQ